MKTTCLALLLLSVFFVSCSDQSDLVFPETTEQASGGGQDDPCKADCD